MNTLFSILIPTYKKKYLKECIDSVLSQTYSGFEIIIVNDASPEDIDSVINSYNDKRIKYIKNETNCGAVNVVDNWNKCLEIARGDFAICMGDDDKLMSNCLDEYLLLIAKHPGLGVYHAWTEIIDEKANFINVTAARCEFESVYSFIWHRWNGREQQFVGDFLYDVQKLKENGGFFKLPMAWASDDITAIIAAKEKGIANTQVPCFCYRINSSTISNTGSIQVKMSALNQEIEWLGRFLEEEPAGVLDRKYWICIKREMTHHFEKKKGITIADDIRNGSYYKLFYWLFNKNKYNISLKMLLYAAIIAAIKR